MAGMTTDRHRFAVASGIGPSALALAMVVLVAACLLVGGLVGYMLRGIGG